MRDKQSIRDGRCHADLQTSLSVICYTIIEREKWKYSLLPTLCIVFVIESGEDSYNSVWSLDKDHLMLECNTYYPLTYLYGECYSFFICR